MQVLWAQGSCSDPRRPLLSCYPHAYSSKTHADTHTGTRSTHVDTCMHTHTRTLAMILEGPFFHVIPVPGSSKAHADAHTQVHTQRTCTHIHTHTHMHTCSDPRRPLLSCYPHACSSKTHADAHTQVHMQCTYAHTHAHTCTHVHTVKPSPCAAASHCPPPLSASPQAPGRGTTALPGDSYTTPSPFPPRLTQHRSKSSVSSLKSECLLPE